MFEVLRLWQNGQLPLHEKGAKIALAQALVALFGLVLSIFGLAVFYIWVYTIPTGTFPDRDTGLAVTGSIHLFLLGLLVMALFCRRGAKNFVRHHQERRFDELVAKTI